MAKLVLSSSCFPNSKYYCYFQNVDSLNFIFLIFTCCTKNNSKHESYFACRLNREQVITQPKRLTQANYKSQRINVHKYFPQNSYSFCQVLQVLFSSSLFSFILKMISWLLKVIWILYSFYYGHLLKNYNNCNNNSAV